MHMRGEPSPANGSSRVLVVDDDVPNGELLKALLAPEGYEVALAASGREALRTIKERAPDLVLLDLLMPGITGLDVLRAMRKDPETRQIPVIMLTGLAGDEEKIRSIRAGANDFITKPFLQEELLLRVASLVSVKRLHDELEQKNRYLSDQKAHLEALVTQRTRELDNLTMGLVAALERANQLNDTDTGNHIRRVCNYSYVLAKGYGLDEEFCKKLQRYASLHDVGKVGIPDSILKKPGKLTDAEISEMKQHTVLGYELLVAAGADPIACNIALYHHEKYDGSGYPHGLKGEDIPIEARIVALADVYDALTTKRCYKDAFSQEESERIIRNDSGKHFDPKLVELFFASREEFAEVKAKWQD